jgi:branched-chain amino acid transport system substrate-binding protein
MILNQQGGDAMKRIGFTLTLVSIGAVLLLVLLMAGEAIAKEGEVSRDYFKVGVITSLSGQNVWGGNVTRRGYEMWADAVNRDGGIEIKGNKYRVHLIFADAQSDPAVGADAVTRMIHREEVDFILGPYSSSVTLATAPIVEKYKVPMITGSAESPKIWKEGFKYTFGAIPSVDLIGGSPIRTLAKDVNPKPKSIFILSLIDPFTEACGAEYKRQAEAAGIEVVGNEKVPDNTSDWTPLITKAKRSGAEIFAMATHLEAALGLMKTAKELDFNPKAYVQHAGMGYADFLGLGKDAEFVIGATVWSPQIEYQGDLPLFKSSASFLEQYQQRYNRAVPEYTEAACAASGIAFQAVIEQLGLIPPLDEKEREALMSGLEKLNILTFYGPVKFATSGDYFHDNSGLTSLTLQIQDGKHVIVGPGSLARVPPRYPTPPWNRR